MKILRTQGRTPLNPGQATPFYSAFTNTSYIRTTGTSFAAYCSFFFIVVSEDAAERTPAPRPRWYESNETDKTNETDETNGTPIKPVPKQQRKVKLMCSEIKSQEQERLFGIFQMDGFFSRSHFFKRMTRFMHETHRARLLALNTVSQLFLAVPYTTTTGQTRSDTSERFPEERRSHLSLVCHGLLCLTFIHSLFTLSLTHVKSTNHYSEAGLTTHSQGPALQKLIQK